MIVLPIYMLDTNTASYFVTSRSSATRRAFFDLQPHARIVLSALTEGELRFGFEKKIKAIRLRNAFESFFDGIEVLSWTSDVAQTYGKLRAQTTSAGINLSSMDLLIAAHAVAVDATLVSHDRAFRHLHPMLKIVDWATDL